ncbi:MAG: hypothetical protein ACE5ES_04305 [Candidatus Nanoarchaeia archaeon]
MGKKLLSGLILALMLMLPPKQANTASKRIVLTQENLEKRIFEYWQERIDTPREASYFLQNIRYVSDYPIDDWKSCIRTLDNWEGDCEDESICAAGLLKDNGYTPLILVMSQNKIVNGEIIEYNGGASHAVFIYKEHSKFKYIDRINHPSKGFNTVEELVKSFKKNYKSYNLINFDELGIDWTNYKGNLKNKVANYLEGFSLIAEN